MLQTDLLPSITKLRIPARYQIASVENGLKVKCLLAHEREVGVQLKPFRHRGRTCRRVLALTAGGEQYILEFATFNDSYEEGTAGIIHSKRPLIRGDLIILESTFPR